MARGFIPLNVVGGPPATPAVAAVPGEDPVLAEVAALGERVGELIESLSSHSDPEVAGQLDQLLDAIDQLHREALTRLSGMLAHHDLLDHARADPLIGAVLEMYELGLDAAGETSAADPAAAAPPASGPPPPGLIPLNAAPSPSLPAPVAVAPASPLVPPPSSPPASAAAPEAAAAARPPSVAETDDEAEPVWEEVCPVEDLPPGAMFAPGEGALLICNVDGELHAYRNGCGNGPLALHMGRLIDGGRLACPWHIGCVYDLTTGISGEPPDQRRLIRYPVRISGDTVEVAFNRGRIPDPVASATGTAR